MSEENIGTTSSGSRGPRKLWLYLIGIVCIGIYAAAFIPAFAGKQVDAKIGPPMLLLTTLFFAFLWQRRGKKARYGVWIGVLVGFLAFALAAFVGGYMRASSGS